MPGRKVSRSSRKLDVVLVAARYDKEGSLLSVAQGYERRGFVWGDIVLFDRSSLIDRLKAKKQVVTGNPGALPGDFESIAHVRLVRKGGGENIVANGHSVEGDDLGLPLF